MLSKLCCVCLKSENLTLKNLASLDKNDTQLIIKLKDIAPKEEWKDSYSICEKCELQLDNAFHFKQLCRKYDDFRRNHDQQPKESNFLHTEEDIDEKKLSPNEENSYDHFDSTERNLVEDNLTKQDNEIEIVKISFVCFHCKKKFKSKNTLKQHLNVQHNPLGSHRRKTKSHKKKDRSSLDSSNKSKKFQCEICSEYFSLLKNIIEHCSTVHSMNPKDVKPYRCSQCSNKFTSSTLLIQHTKYHIGDRTYVCSICGKSFITKRDLSGHEKLHDNQRKYCCDKCDKSFNTSQNLKTHVFVVHTDSSQWKYQCQVCFKRFAMRANFNEHVKRHQGNKDFTCHICNKTFVSNHEVKKHVKIHSNIAHFKCSHCPKYYHNKRYLDHHLFKTHGIGLVKLPVRVKKFVCHICPSQFYDNHNLQRHLRTHANKSIEHINANAHNMADKV